MKRISKYIVLVGSFLVILGFSNRPYDLKEDMIAWYPLDGNLNDSSGNNRHGKIFGDPVDTFDRFDHIDKAYYLDGSNDYFVFPVGKFSNFSVSFWMYIENTYGLAGIMDYGYQEMLASIDFISGATPPASKVVYQMPNGNKLRFNHNFQHHMWYHIYIDAGTPTLPPRIFVNGKLDKQADLSSELNPKNGDLYFGSISDTSQIIHFRFWGRLDDIRVFDRILSRPEIESIYNEYVSLEEDNLPWKMSGAYPNPVNDILHVKSENVATIRLYNSAGQLMKEKRNTNTLDMSTMEPGIYLVECIDKNGLSTFVQKIYKTDNK